MFTQHRRTHRPGLDQRCGHSPGNSVIQHKSETPTMATPNWIKNMLEKRGVAYEERHHRVAFTAQEVAQSEHVSGDCLAKVVVVIADGRPVELILPASRRVDARPSARAAWRRECPPGLRGRDGARSSPIARRGRSRRCVTGRTSPCSWTHRCRRRQTWYFRPAHTRTPSG